MKNKKAFGLFLFSLISTTAFAAPPAVTFSQISYIAGKANVLTLQNGSGVDITATSTLSYAGPELRIGTFAGKPYVQGITAGSNYDIIVKDTASGTLLGDVLVSVTPGSYYRLAVVSGDSQSVVAGMAPTTPLVVQAQDMYRNPVSGQVVTVAMPNGSTQSLTSDSSGNITIPYSSGANSGGESVSVSAGYSNISFNERVVPPTNGVYSVAISGLPDSVDVGVNFSIVASLFDSTGAAVTGAYSVKMAAYSDSTCSFIKNNIPSQTLINSNGVVSFSGLSDSTPEKVYIGVFSGGHGACSRALTVSPTVSTVSKVVFSQTPGLGVSGVYLFPPTSVQLLDLNNRLVSSSSDLVVVSAYSDSACSSSLPAANNTKSASAGQMTLNSFQITTVGSAYIQASDAGFKSSCYGPITLTASNSPISTPTPTPVPTPVPTGPPAQLLITNFPSTANTGVALNPGVTVKIKDASGALVNSSSSNVSLSAFSDSSCSTQINGSGYLATIVGGQFVFPMTLTGTGNVYFHANDSGDGLSSNCAGPMNIPFASSAIVTPSGPIFSYLSTEPNAGGSSKYLNVSYDFGQSLKRITLPGNTNDIKVYAISGQNIIAWTDHSAYYISTDEGNTFSLVNFPYTVNSVLSISMSGSEILINQQSPSNPGGQNGLYLSRDLGQHFQQIPVSSFFGNNSTYEINMGNVYISGSNIFIPTFDASSNPFLIYSTDLGQSMHNFGMPHVARSYTTRGFNLTGNSLINWYYTAGAIGNISVDTTTNFGQTVSTSATSLPVPTAGTYDYVLRDSNVMLFPYSTGSQIIISQDMGNTSKNLPIPFTATAVSGYQISY